MTPTTKATVITVAALISIAAVPVLLVVLQDWLAVIAIAVIYPAVLYLFFKNMYDLIRTELLQRMLEDKRIIDSFDNDPLKIHFYRGFKKYFDGDLDADRLKHWLEQHRPPY
jgi:LPS O-antigen subunit length determinant protein (WzzB/FepE family)